MKYILALFGLALAISASTGNAAANVQSNPTSVDEPEICGPCGYDCECSGN